MHVHEHGRSHGVDPTSPLGFTGERVIPDDPKWAWCFQAHLFGYDDLAKRIPKGVTALDIGCGEGYGAAHLAGRARLVVTGDVAFDAVKHARDRYRGGNIRWVVFDGTRLPFRSDAFDVVSSLQVIEHFAGTDEHLGDVARVLRRDGLHYVTTPNIDLMGEAEKDNPYHLRDFTAQQLGEALTRHFEDVSLEGMFYVEDSPRTQRMQAAEANEERLRPRLRKVEAMLARLPGALRVRLRSLVRRMAGIHEWPLPEAESARNEIVAADFFAGEPAEKSFCLIGVTRKPRKSRA
jgi:SAM-dependent methyltransferase